MLHDLRIIENMCNRKLGFRSFIRQLSPCFSSEVTMLKPVVVAFGGVMKYLSPVREISLCRENQQASVVPVLYTIEGAYEQTGQQW